MSGALALALLFFMFNPPRAAAVTWDCGLLQDCGFDNFYGDAGAGSGPWKIFKASGASGLSLIASDGWPAGPSLKVSGDSPFESGVYQQVPVTPGNGYTFSLAYAVVNIGGAGWHDGDQVNRKLGIDPYGGVDPNAATVTWSGDFFARGKFQDDVLQVSEYARSSTITVFIRVINPYSGKHVDVFVDSARLELNTGMAPIQVTAPTATNAPPPTSAPATARPTRVPTTVAIVPTAIVPPTDSPALTSTPTVSATMPVDDTAIPAPTRIRRPTATPVPTATPDTGVSTRILALGVVGLVALCGIGFALALLVVAFWYWRRSRKLVE
ncbi:MAG: hypothetical protein WCF84_02530 [Anaerolineae bacterium]